MLVLMSRLIWAAETANTAGPILRSTRRTPESRRAAPRRKVMRGSMPIFISEGTCTATCRAPPTITENAIA